MALAPPSDGANLDDLELTIRFSASLPDLPLSIPLSTQPNANTSTLKQLIRSHLPSDYKSRRIRLIYSGRALADDDVLATTLRRPVSRPLTRTSTPRPDTPTPTGANSRDALSAKARGKTPIRDLALPPSPRIYIHCSIGDVVLTTAELAEEASQAVAAAAAELDSTNTTSTRYQLPQHHESRPPSPHGFDRLLTSGFTPAEVSSLRMQFLAIQAHTHTQDMMPSPTTMRALEDQWLDNSNTGASSSAALLESSPDGSTALTSSEESESGALDDMIYGTAMGFFWPLGCMMWLGREAGVWSARRRMAVVVGFLLNVGLGFVRVAG
jgi:iron-sulfur cluster assembly 1